jgi:hypothetical protein
MTGLTLPFQAEQASGGPLVTLQNSSNGCGLYASSVSASGVWGQSQSSSGVTAYSTSGSGVSATSQSGAGIQATGSPAGQFEGDVQITGRLTGVQDIVLTGADFAEEFDLIGTVDAEPGTVMVLDGEGGVKPSCLAYDRRVAGIISGAGEYRPGIILDRRDSTRPRGALALVGKVFCKVDADYAPIDIGDMLTTSPTCGHAMKAVDPAQSFGAVVGKALRPISQGEGLIPVLVALQ